MRSPHRPVAPKRGRRTQEERSAGTRRRLLDAAVECICEQGFATLTTTQIAERAGVSRGALQHQFGTRFDVLAAVIDDLAQKITAETLARAGVLTGCSHSLDQRIEAAIEAYWAIYTSDIFFAVLNIFHGVVNDPKHYRPLQRHMGMFSQMTDDVWLNLVAGAKRPKPVLLAARRVFFSALRGLAVSQVLGTQPRATQVELHLIKDMFVAALAREPAD